MMEREKVQQAQKGAQKESMVEGQKQAEIKKWKGKDWFAILAPKLFGSKIVTETPTTDPNSLIGRNVFTTVADLTGKKNSYYMKIRLRVVKAENKNLQTEFNGFECVREYLTRFVRKRSDKIENSFYVETGDGVRLQVNTLTISLRKIDSGTKTSIRKVIVDYFTSESKKASLDQFVKGLVDEKYKSHSRALINKVYPTKFHEISKVEVIKRSQQA